MAEDESRADRSPAERVSDAVERWDEQEVVRRCVSVLRLGAGDALVGDGLELAVVLGGLSDPGWLAVGKSAGRGYWARVWAARALLYSWGDSATEAVIDALDDEQWRVREMAAKVIRLRELSAAADRLAALTADAVPRVRVASARALAAVGEGEHAATVMALTGDPERVVARAAMGALDQLSRRLDRAF